MAIRNILVHVGTTLEAERRLAVASSLSGLFEAKLTGLTVVPPPSWGGYAGLPQLVADLERSNTAHIKAARDLFARAAGQKPLPNEFRSYVGDGVEILAEEAAFADLMVIGQSSVESEEVQFLDADRVLLASPAPVLVVPHDYQRAFQPGTVLVAWKNTREAARAVRDALPFLHRAKKVIVAVVAHDDAEKAAAHLSDLTRHLARHGLEAETTALPAEGAVGRTLIGLAERHSADSVVAGGYGHAPLREWIMGGVTQALLSDSRVPCLLSH